MLGPTQVKPEEDKSENHKKEENIPIDWQVGDIILGTYEVRDVFTTGGMGNVYHVHHCGWNIDLAVKSPKSEILNSATNIQIFIRECETWVNLGLHTQI